jgi:hypothetical protein
MKSKSKIEKIHINSVQRVSEKPKLLNFHMSFRFDKTKPEDFGLIYSKHENLIIDPKDGSQWIKRHLIDLGWGLEVAFCRLPYPTFDELLVMSIYSNSNNKSADFYCALGILINDYSLRFLDFTERLFDSNHDLHKYIGFYQVVKTQIHHHDETINKRWQVIFERVNCLM